MKQLSLNITILVVLTAFVVIQETSAEIKRNSHEPGNTRKIREVMDKLRKQGKGLKYRF